MPIGLSKPRSCADIAERYASPAASTAPWRRVAIDDDGFSDHLLGGLCRASTAVDEPHVVLVSSTASTRRPATGDPSMRRCKAVRLALLANHECVEPLTGVPRRASPAVATGSAPV